MTGGNVNTREVLGKPPCGRTCTIDMCYRSPSRVCRNPSGRGREKEDVSSQ